MTAKAESPASPPAPGWLKNRSAFFPLVFLMPLAAVWIFSGLGATVLQVDEGADTFIATTILKYGYPRHSNGVNHTMDYADVRSGIFVYRTWVPYYLEAASLFIFGKTTFAARFPFALAGWLSVAALYVLAWKMTRRRMTATVAAGLLAFSVPAALLFRTARYVGLPVLFTVLLIIFYLRLYEDREWRPQPFTVTAIFYFHTMFVEFAGVVLGILIHFLIHRNTIRPGSWKKAGLCAGEIAAFTLPWLIWMLPVFSQVQEAYVMRTDAIDLSAWGYLKRFAGYWFQINVYVFPLVLFPLLFLKRLEPFRREIRLLLICILSVIGVGTLHSIPLSQYVAATIPLFCLLTALIVTEAVRNRIVQAGLAVLLVTTNIIHTGPLLPVKAAIEARPGWFESSGYLRRAYHTFLREVRLSSPLVRYLREIRHPYRGPLDAVVRFFKTHGKPGETCYIDNEVEAFVFYTGMKMIRNQEITPRDRPGWIVLRGSRTDLAGGAPPADAVDRTLNHILQTGSYKPFILHSTPRRHNNSYEIQLHLYESPPTTGRLYVYQRVPPRDNPAD